MTDELLKGLASQGANMAKTAIEQHGRVNGVLAVYFEGGTGLRRLVELEATAEKHGGPGWLNSERVKTATFEAMRGSALALERPPDAMVIVAAADYFHSNAAFAALPEEEQKRLAFSGKHRNMPEYFETQEVLISTAQSPERVCIYKQRIERRQFVGEPHFAFTSQAEFHGRTKLYGFDPPNDVKRALAEFKRGHGTH